MIVDEPGEDIWDQAFVKKLSVSLKLAIPRCPFQTRWSPHSPATTFDGIQVKVSTWVLLQHKLRVCELGINSQTEYQCHYLLVERN